MIISPRHKFLFVHIHKCAGTSIEIALNRQLAVNDLVFGSTPDGERLQNFFGETINLKKHSTALQARAFLGPKHWGLFFKFAFVRHPVDRLHSLYTYAKGLAERAMAQQLAAGKELTNPPPPGPLRFKAVQAAVASPTFDDFVQHPKTWLDPGAHPQWKSVCDENGQLILDFIGKVENLAEDWATVLERLKLDVHVGNQNRSHIKADSTLSEASAKLVASTYERDFSLFDYELTRRAGASVL